MPAKSKSQFRYMQYLKHEGSPKERSMASEYLSSEKPGDYKKLPESVDQNFKKIKKALGKR